MFKLRRRLLFSGFVFGLAMLGGSPAFSQETPSRSSVRAPPKKSHSPAALQYVDRRFGFSFRLPASWRGYKILVSEWQGQDEAEEEHGSVVTIRHPLWTEENPREDIDIMVFTLRQWRMVDRGTLNVSAAGYPPSELRRNRKYVFAEPPREFIDELEGYEEAIGIMHGNPLRAF
jgi:hypothetical protein